MQVGHEVWTFQEGAPENIVALAQTDDGFLWLGGPTGLFRFDGTRFEPFHSPFGDKLLSTNVHDLFAPPSGGLWIGYAFGGFSFLKDRRVTNYGETSSSGAVYDFAQDRDGNLWAATSSGLWRFEQSRWNHVGSEWNAPTDFRGGDRLGLDRAGILWVIAGKTLSYLRPGATRFEVAETELLTAFPEVSGFTLDADHLVVTTASWKPSASIPLGKGEDAPRAYPLLNRSSETQIDRSGGLWIDSIQGPMTHVTPAGSIEETFKAGHLQTERLTKLPHWETRGVNSETFDIDVYGDSSAVLVDREGNIWFGGASGLHRFFYTPFVPQKIPISHVGSAIGFDDHGLWIGSFGAPLYYVVAGQPRPLPSNLNWTLSFVYRAPDKTVWLGTTGSGLWHETQSRLPPVKDTGRWSKVRRDLWDFTGRDWMQIDLPTEAANDALFLQAITQDRLGGMWVSLGRHGLYRLAGGVWTPYGGRSDIPKTGVICEFTDALGRVWFGFTKNQVAILDGDRLQVFGSSDGVSVGNTTAIYGRGPEIWIGGEFGLEQFKDGRFRKIIAADEEWLRGISGIVETADGDLWLNGLSGVFHIRHAEVSDALQNSSHRVTGEHFGRREGVPGTAAQLRPLPTAVEGTDGRLWFALSRGVVWIDPHRSPREVPSLPVTIQSIFGDEKYYALVFPLKFPPRTSSVQINYAAVSLLDPEAIRFRYKLQETDKEWHEVAEAGPVSYRNLGPGSYHFSVAATDTNGVWSDKVATAQFTILPAFYQTRWFLALCTFTAMALVYLFYQLRLAQATQRVRASMEVRLAERERIARDLHDTLLQSVQGLILKVQAATNQIPREEPARQAIEKTLDHADKVLAEGRDRVRNLRASAESLSDLPAAFQQVANETLQGRDTSFKTVVEGNVRCLHPMVLEECFAIGQEALINALSHSGGPHVEVEITYDPRQFRLRVRDDGSGIDPAVLEKGGRSDHWGLQGMRERAGRIGAELQIWSRPGAGTEVELTVPGNTAYRALRVKPRGFWLRRSPDID